MTSPNSDSNSDEELAALSIAKSIAALALGKLNPLLAAALAQALGITFGTDRKTAQEVGDAVSTAFPQGRFDPGKDEEAMARLSGLNVQIRERALEAFQEVLRQMKERASDKAEELAERRAAVAEQYLTGHRQCEIAEKLRVCSMPSDLVPRRVATSGVGRLTLHPMLPNAPIDVTARTNLTVTSDAVVSSGTGTISLRYQPVVSACAPQPGGAGRNGAATGRGTKQPRQADKRRRAREQRQDHIKWPEVAQCQYVMYIRGASLEAAGAYPSVSELLYLADTPNRCQFTRRKRCSGAFGRSG